MAITANDDAEQAALAPRQNEHILPLTSGRELHYARSGTQSSRTVILFFSGLFAIGRTSKAVPGGALDRLGADFLAPTNAGMGVTSVYPKDGKTYVEHLIGDMNELLEATHQHPDNIDALYVGGGSYGTAMAQMLYGASYDAFPWGRKIRGMLLMGGFSPFKYHENYAASLSWPNWVSVGPPSCLPLRPMQWLFRLAVGGKFSTVRGAVSFLDSNLFGRMSPEEREAMDKWLATQTDDRGEPLTYEGYVRGMAAMNVRSLQYTWDGFMNVSDVLHSDWGFDPRSLDDSHAKPVLVVGGSEDHLGGQTNAWLTANYRNAKLKTVPGGHISAAFYMDEIFDELVQVSEEFNKGNADTAEEAAA